MTKDVKKEVVKIRIAVISDIHGNIVALDAILEDLKKDKIDKVVSLGDFCNELPNGNEVAERLREINAYSILGNKEEYFIQYDEKRYDWKNIQFRNTIYMFDLLTKENLEYMRNLPFSISDEFDGVKIKFVHGSPESVYELVHENDVDKLDKYSKSLEEDMLVLGHTHDPIWVRRVNGKTIVNAGCAGVSVYNIGEAEYVILDCKNGKCSVERHMVKYDLEQVKANIINSGITRIERTFSNLVFLAIDGMPEVRRRFYHTAIEKMERDGRKLYRDDAEGIFKTFKLLDDDVWIEGSKEVEKYFLI